MFCLQSKAHAAGGGRDKKIEAIETGNRIRVGFSTRLRLEQEIQMIISKARDLIIGLGISASKLASSLTMKKVQASGNCESARISTTKIKALKSVTTNQPSTLRRPVKLKDSSREERVTYAKMSQTRLEALSAHLNKSQEFTIDEL